MTGLTFVRSGLAALFLLALPGLAAAQAGGLNQTDPGRDFTRVWREYPDMNAEFSRDGQVRSLAQVRAIRIGDSKTALVRNAGQPVSASADGSWHFNVKLPLPQRNQLVCQLKVYFDAEDKVAETVWRRPQCANLIGTGKAQG